MKVFIASSREAIKDAVGVAAWLEKCQPRGHQALVWDDADLSRFGIGLLSKLTDLADHVDAGVFVLSPDDRVWVRGETGHQARDNVLVEFGLFAGKLGIERTAIFKKGRVRIPQDLAGIEVIEGDAERPNSSRWEFINWAERIDRQLGRRQAAVNRGRFQEGPTLQVSPELSPEDLVALVEASSLRIRKINLSSRADVFTSLELEALAKVKTLRYLTLEGSQLIDQDLAALVEIAELRFLNIASCYALTDAALEYVGKMSKLETLKVAYCDQISGAGLSKLAPLIRLKRLDLTGCAQLIDRDLRPLEQLEALEDLSLNGCSGIAGSGLLATVSKMGSLRRLDISFCELPDSQIERLQQLRPDLEILGYFLSLDQRAVP